MKISTLGDKIATKYTSIEYILLQFSSNTFAKILTYSNLIVKIIMIKNIPPSIKKLQEVKGLSNNCVFLLLLPLQI